MIKNVLFDLDGCITDSFEGIANSVAYALRKFNIEVSDKNILRPFAGPPLVDSFEKYYNMEEAQAKQALEYYREYYVPHGMFENRVYNGVEEMLCNLKKDEKEIFLATSKPLAYAEEILKNFNLDRYFTKMFGASLDEKISTKEQVLSLALSEISSKKDEIIMVGDTMFDVIGAHAHGIECIGVTYGYGTEEELKKVFANYLAKNPEKVYNIIKSI